MSVILKISDDLDESKGEPHFTSWVYYASKKYKCAFWIQKSEFNSNIREEHQITAKWKNEYKNVDGETFKVDELTQEQLDKRYETIHFSGHTWRKVK